MRRLLFCLTCLCLAAPGLALAEEGPAGNDCQNVSPIAGTARYRTATLALRSNATTFGAAGMVERMVLPYLKRAPKEEVTSWGAVGTELVNQFGVLRLPTVETSSGCPRELKYSVRSLDTAGMGFGFGYRWDDWGIFYAGSITYSMLAVDNVALRTMIASAAAMGSSYAIFAAPFYNPDIEEGVLSVNLDWIGGLMYDAKYVQFALGYVGSSGLYARVNETTLDAFLSVVWQDDFSLFSLLTGGIGPIETPYGSPMIYARIIDLPSPGVTDPETGVTGKSPNQADWTTLHLEIRDLADYVDLRAAWAFQPESQLAEAILAVHTVGFNTGRSEEGSNEQGVAGFRLAAGAVGVPTMHYYGRDGGLHFSLDAEMRIGIELASVFMAFRYNAPDMLAIFPYGTGALTFNYGFSGSF